MSRQVTPDEQPKDAIARTVVTQKRQYFMSEHGITIEASDAAEANEILRKQQRKGKKKEQEVSA